MRESTATSAAPAIVRDGDAAEMDAAVEGGAGKPTVTPCPNGACNDGLLDDGSVCPDCNAAGATLSEADRDRFTALEAEVARLREGRTDKIGTTFGDMKPVKTGDGRDGWRMVLIREGGGSTGYYTPDTLREFVESKRGEGMQAYADHPTLDDEQALPERSIRDLVGSHHDITLGSDSMGALVESTFVPITGPGYEWVSTLAEAAANNPSSKPLVGVSLYGESAGHMGDRPDGKYGWIATRLLPSSGDIVTNGGAGGEFARRLIESLRGRRAARKPEERMPMKLDELQGKIREASQRLREAKTDEDRTAALAELDALSTAAVEGPAATPPTTIEALQESAPALAATLREAAKAEVATDLAEANRQLKEARDRDLETAQTLQTYAALNDLKVDAAEAPFYLDQIKLRGLREAAEIKTFIEADLARQTRLREEWTASLSGLGTGVEGVPGRVPAAAAATDGGVAHLRESGIPTREPAAA